MTDGLEEFNNLVAAGECIAIGAKCLDAGHAREEILEAIQQDIREQAE